MKFHSANFLLLVTILLQSIFTDVAATTRLALSLAVGDRNGKGSKKGKGSVGKGFSTNEKNGQSFKISGSSPSNKATSELTTISSKGSKDAQMSQRSETSGNSLMEENQRFPSSKLRKKRKMEDPSMANSQQLHCY